MKKINVSFCGHPKAWGEAILHVSDSNAMRAVRRDWKWWLAAAFAITAGSLWILRAGRRCASEATKCAEDATDPPDSKH